jgi:peptidoglycan hydrolase CwlO-like protein
MAAKKRVSISVDQLTTRQLLLHVVIPTLTVMEKKMTDLSQSVEDLKSAVDGVAQRLLPEIAALEEALAAAQADDADAAAAAADAQAAVANIRTEVDRLNALGTDPSTPVDTETPPAEPPEVEVPADPDAPHVDNTLPGDLPQDPEATQLPS